MKAAVCYEPGKPLEVKEVKLDPPQKGEVKIRLAATAICHSDIHILRGEFGFQSPVIAGHESAGYVAEVGEGVTKVKAGDPVVISLVASCGHCYYCLRGQFNLCNHNFPLGSDSRFHDEQGKLLRQVFMVGSFAEYTVVDQSQVTPLTADIPFDKAALLGCGVITGFGSVVWRAKVQALNSVVVIGTGGVGLNAIQGAAYTGAYPVIAVDILDSKLEAAKKFGATHTVNSKQVDVVTAVKELTGGRGADFIFVTVGSMAAVQQGYKMSGSRGTTVMVGLPKPTDGLSLNCSPLEFIRTEKVLMGSYMGSVNLDVHIPQLVALYKAGKLKLDELVSGHYPIEKINEAIESVENGKALRNVIMF